MDSVKPQLLELVLVFNKPQQINLESVLVGLLVEVVLIVKKDLVYILIQHPV
jgi:hypothetical protein